jgi:hypothetical protein
MSFWLVTHFLLCAYMTGVIWLIQLVHYPSFQRINAGEFRAFHSTHTRFLGLLVGPAMVGELVSAAVLASTWEPLWILNFALVLALWGATFFMSVPLHNTLAAGRDPRAMDRLVLTNWPRTCIWTVRAMMIAGYFYSNAKF